MACKELIIVAMPCDEAPECTTYMVMLGTDVVYEATYWAEQRWIEKVAHNTVKSEAFKH